MKLCKLFPIVALALVFAASAGSAQAGLLDRMLGGGGYGHSHGCCEPTCCAPEPTCCAPEPTCCAPEPTCCAPEPSCCCEPAPCCHKRCNPLKGLFGWLKKCCQPRCCCEPSCCAPEPTCGCEPSCGCGY